ncbi:BgTH12-07764 [Blumeria graminis f. sp. triticale]|uniref:BgTH12-07764 n=1 Tax=Blumeria graminis f. sp. triticale TaxID=1689686 RepID=A0A9W4DDR0_BLUGR|nr:BgTH12-07764 [Blumeria graminis f. sp. triticale]
MPKLWTLVAVLGVFSSLDTASSTSLPHVRRGNSNINSIKYICSVDVTFFGSNIYNSVNSAKSQAGGVQLRAISQSASNVPNIQVNQLISWQDGTFLYPIASTSSSQNRDTSRYFVVLNSNWDISSMVIQYASGDATPCAEMT